MKTGPRLAASPLLLALLLPIDSQSAPDHVVLDPLFATNTFEQALGLVPAGDGSNRLFVVRQNGIVEVIDENQVLDTPFIDITDQTAASGERGLLGLAFHPDFQANGRVFVNYTANNVAGIPDGDTVISEYEIDDSNPNRVDPGSERILMTIAQDDVNHNGGNIKFGPDGYLYIGMGDGGSSGDPCNRAQTLDPDQIQTGGSCLDDPTVALLGKMLRIDVDLTTPAGSNNLCAAAGDGSAEYAIPGDNPFAGNDNACGEVWTLGLRNPWRWSFDRATGDLWIGDVGQSHWEEVNLEPSDHTGGANYGWNECEASFTYPAQSPPEQCAFDHAFPVLEYSIDGEPECAITGGYRYRGPVTGLRGIYIYGDHCSGKIWFAEDDGAGNWSETEFSEEGFGLRSFGEDEAGNVYVVRSGGIWRFAHDPADLVFVDRFENGE